MPHCADEVAGHARKAKQALAAHLDEWADDLVHISARAEVSARAAQNDSLHPIIVVKRIEGRAQLLIAVEGQRVLALGAVERNRCNAVLELPKEARGIERRRVKAHALVPPSIVISAPLMSRESGEQSMAMAAPIASGSTSRPLAFILVIASRKSSSFRPVTFETRAID